MRDTRLPWIVITAVAFVVIVLVVLSVTVFPALLIDPPAADQLEEMTAKDRLDAQNDVRQTLLQAIAGLLLLAGVVSMPAGWWASNSPEGAHCQRPYS